MLPYRNPELSQEERTRDILSRMTVEEKIGQLVKLDGFRSYKMENGKLIVLDSWLDFMDRYPAGTMSVLLRADWWTGINWTNGITPDRARDSVRCGFQIKSPAFSDFRKRSLQRNFFPPKKSPKFPETSGQRRIRPDRPMHCGIFEGFPVES